MSLFTLLDSDSPEQSEDTVIPKRTGRMRTPEYGLLDLIAHICGVRPKQVNPQAIRGLQEVLPTLTETERQVLTLRYGLNGKASRTLAEVGTLIGGRSRERVRQIQSKALRRLRHPSRYHLLKPFILPLLEAQHDIRWCSPIMMLGEGIQNWSRTYRTQVYCAVGVSEVNGLIRLYPIQRNERVSHFDIVETIIRNEHPEGHRLESRKIYPGCLRVIGHEPDKAEQLRILKSLCEAGQFLHAGGWRTQTIGVIKPKQPHFWITKTRKLMVRYKCSVPDCRGHLNEVLEVIKVDKVGRRWRPKVAQLKNYIERLSRSELYFVMGTHRNHPHRWILIAIHSFPISTHREKETSAIQAKGGAMQVLVIVTDDDGKSETFQVDRIKTTKNYVKFGAGDMGNPIISTIYIRKDFKATRKTKKS